jgi:HD-GYP domain-containing protein (c-di-GMP phosphodiesterase class II)
MAWDPHQIPSWTEIVTQALLQSLRERDPYTYGHCLRVGRYARLLAKAAGLSEFEQQMIYTAGTFHDLGKIGIPDRVLMKSEKLTHEEVKIIQDHPAKSIKIMEPLSVVPFFNSMIPGVLHHHERVDGCGYPFQIQGDQIPLHARIILIVDTFDAITTTRSYRAGRPVEFAYSELKKFSGRQFDARLAEIFLKAHPTWNDPEEEITEEFVRNHFRRAA